MSFFSSQKSDFVRQQGEFADDAAAGSKKDASELLEQNGNKLNKIKETVKGFGKIRPSEQCEWLTGKVGSLADKFFQGPGPVNVESFNQASNPSTKEKSFTPPTPSKTKAPTPRLSG